MNFGIICSTLYNWFTFGSSLEKDSNSEQQNNQSSFSDFGINGKITGNLFRSLNSSMNNPDSNQPISSINFDGQDGLDKEDQLRNFMVKAAEDITAKSMKVYKKIIRATEKQVIAFCSYTFIIHSMQDPTFKKDSEKWVLAFQKIEKLVQEVFIEIKGLFIPIYGGCVIEAGFPAFMVKKCDGFEDSLPISQNVNSRKSIDYLTFLLELTDKSKTKKVFYLINEKKNLYLRVLASGKSIDDIFYEHIPNDMERFYVANVFKIAETINAEPQI